MLDPEVMRIRARGCTGRSAETSIDLDRAAHPGFDGGVKSWRSPMKGVLFAALLATAGALPALAQAPASDPAAPPQDARRGPANLCQELVAFLHPPAPAGTSAAPAPS